MDDFVIRGSQFAKQMISDSDSYRNSAYQINQRLKIENHEALNTAN